MFQTLHRIYVLGWATLAVLFVVWLYPRTGISEPLIDWYTVWQNGHQGGPKPVEELSGRVMQVLDGTSLLVHSADGQRYSVGLLGAVAPAGQARSGPADALARSKALLTDLVLSNQVDVLATFLDQQHRAVGIVHLGDTNINAAVIEAGFLKLDRKVIGGLPLRDQYALIRADRKSRHADSETRQ